MAMLVQSPVTPPSNSVYTKKMQWDRAYNERVNHGPEGHVIDQGEVLSTYTTCLGKNRLVY